MIGAQLGPYRILAMLGAGGMGEVYRGVDTRLDRVVAIKILPRQVANDPRRAQRFARESRAVSKLNHPHICTLYDVGEHDGVPFIVMEFLEGETLARRLTQGALPLDRVVPVATEIADALVHAHRHGIVHRDLKPANIMLTPAGAKLLDFGIAALQEPAIASADSATAGTGPGTLTEEGTINASYTRNQYVVSRDGERFLINEPVRTASPSIVTIVVNWTATMIGPVGS